MFRIIGFIVYLCAPLFEKWLNFKYNAGGFLRKRYYESRLGSCGKDLVVNGKPILFNLQRINVGNHVTINNGCQISPQAGNVKIDDYVVMSRGSQITAGQLDTKNWKICGGGYKSAPHIASDVHIGEGCWLCVNSVVLPGVNISGKGVIVAAGAIVTKDIEEDYVIVAGIPAKIVKRLV